VLAAEEDGRCENDNGRCDEGNDYERKHGGWVKAEEVKSGTREPGGDGCYGRKHSASAWPRNDCSEGKSQERAEPCELK